MEIAGVIERAERIVAVRGDVAADKQMVQSGLVAVRELRSWCDAQHAGLVGQLAGVDSFPESTIAAADKTSIGCASTSKARSETLGGTPRLAGALDEGAITAGHVDAVTRVGKGLSDSERAELLERVDHLADVAAAGTVEQFSKRVRLEADRVRRGDGMDRLERQRRDVRLSSWTDAEGMWNVRGRFDPVTGVTLAAAIDRAVETLFTEATPALAPSDPVEQQRFLAAHALARLLDGAGSGKPGRTEILAVIDTAPVVGDSDNEAAGLSPEQIAWRLPVEIPARILAELADAPTTDVVGVVVCNGVVLHAPGQLDQGRTSRLANRAQRRALRAMYATCGIPGCSVGFDRCHIHHVIWWRHGGRSDLANLLPVCSKHHGKIHHDGWVVELGPNRRLTLRLPDGAVMTTGPPTIRAA